MKHTGWLVVSWTRGHGGRVVMCFLIWKDPGTEGFPSTILDTSLLFENVGRVCQIYDVWEVPETPQILDM